MRIGIDARLWFETGVGRYIRNLVTNLARIDNKNHYILFLPKRAFNSVTLPNNRWEKREADVHWHTFSEQFVMPFLFAKEKLDVVHIPYFNIPIFYAGRVVATVHDLTILHTKTGKATTLPQWVYTLRRFGYRIVMEIGLRRASSIIAVSETTKKDIVSNFAVAPGKIYVTYEGIDKEIRNTSGNGKSLVEGAYLLYVGNAYPHKNLERLLDAFGEVQKNLTDTKLVLVGREDFFTNRLKAKASTLASHKNIIFWGEASEQDLSRLYAHANAFVFPSLAEGFGLPALEALSFGCPIICSDIPVFHEVLGDIPTYVDPMDISDIKNAITHVLSTNERPNAVIDKRFSWEIMAAKTLEVYERSARL